MPGAEDQQQSQDTTTESTELKSFSADYVTGLRQEAAKWRTEHKKLEKQIADADSARMADEQKKLAEQGQYKELAEKAQRDLANLAEKAKLADRYQAVLASALEAQKQGLPEAITKLLDRLDPAEQMEWLAENRATATQVDATGQEAARQQLAGFNPKGQNHTQETDRDRIRRLQRQSGQIVSPF